MKVKIKHVILTGLLTIPGLTRGHPDLYRSHTIEQELGIRQRHAELEDLVERYHESKTQPPPTRIYSVGELVRLLKYENIDIRINAEKVYQAKKRIDVRIGALLPSLNFGNLIASVIPEYFDLVPSLLGFVFPANWFKWQESLLFFEAERWGYITLSANQINILLAEIYKVDYVHSLARVYALYLSKMEKLAQQAAARLEMGEGRLDAKLELDNLLILLNEDRISLLTELKKLKYFLGYIINLNISRWNHFEIENLTIPDLGAVAKVRPSDLLAQVEAVSPELREMEYLIEASRYSRKSRKFDFFNPGGSGDTALGYGYISQLKIGKSQTAQLELQMLDLKNNLKLATYRASEDFNLAIVNYKNHRRGLRNATRWFEFLETRFYEGGEYEAQDFVEALSSMIEFHSKMLNSEHLFMISSENIRRLTLGSPYYEGLDELTPKIPSKSLCLTRKMENRKIKKAKKSGKLKLSL